MYIYFIFVKHSSFLFGIMKYKVYFSCNCWVISRRLGTQIKVWYFREPRGYLYFGHNLKGWLTSSNTFSIKLKQWVMLTSFSFCCHSVILSVGTKRQWGHHSEVKANMGPAFMEFIIVGKRLTKCLSH